MLFRPVRTLFIILIAFVAGIFFERQSHADQCLDLGGKMKNGFCIGAKHE